MSFDLELLKKIRCRILDRSNGKPVAGVVASLAVSIGEADKPVRIPVGTLRSDATGYLSFDLKPLVDLGLQTASGLLISAPCAGLQNHNLLETLAASRRIEGDSNLRVALPSHLQSEKDAKRQPLCVVFPVYVEKPKHNHGSCDCDSRCHAADLVSIQSPDACDYEVSPYSFVNPTKINFGGDCCETLVPSTLPVQEHGFYKVVVRREASDKMASIGGRIDREVRVTGELESQKNRSIKFAEVLEYRQRWYALGHSLGEIKYSLPLAPGETIQLAVIEWSRDDTASRYDRVRGTEYLQHELRRDRSIEESVDAGLKESQGGWSLMGGLSTGAAYDAGQYGKYTGNAAVGGR